MQPEECPECDGAGVWSEPDEDHPGMANQGECEACGGTGVLEPDPEDLSPAELAEIRAERAADL